jgi:hypothetical protein
MNFYMDQIEVIIPTSIAPWHPSTKIIEETVASVQQLFPEKVHPKIYCDWPPDWSSKEEREGYDSYCHQLERLDIGQVIRAASWLGLPGIIKMAIERLDAPLVLNFQHDWVLLGPERVRFGELIQAMLCPNGHPEIHIVRFHKRNLPQRTISVDRRYSECTQFPIPLIRTDGWGDSPHIATREHYLTRVLPVLSLDHGADGRYGMEGPVWRSYQRDIKERGFEAAQEEWGSYLYGRFGDGPYIRHTGREATRWRRKKGVQPKKK